MTAPAPHFGAVCDRCSRPYRSPHFPSESICRRCYLGALSGADLAAALLTPWGTK